MYVSMRCFCRLFKAERTCQSGFTKCQSTNICIPRTYLCDGDNDCGDMSDESPTHCGKLIGLLTSLHFSNLFQCSLPLLEPQLQNLLFCSTEEIKDVSVVLFTLVHLTSLKFYQTFLHTFIQFLRDHFFCNILLCIIYLFIYLQNWHFQFYSELAFFQNFIIRMFSF